MYIIANKIGALSWDVFIRPERARFGQILSATLHPGSDLGNAVLCKQASGRRCITFFASEALDLGL